MAGKLFNKILNFMGLEEQVIEGEETDSQIVKLKRSI